MSKMIALLLMGCGTAPSAVEIDGEETLVIHKLGDLALPSARALDAEGHALAGDHAVTWTVGPEGVGSLSEDGATVHLLAEGTVTVTAAIGAVTDSFTVTVSLPDTVVIDASAAAGLVTGASATLFAQVTADGTPIEGADLAWSVSDPTVATITESGELTLLAPGTVVVTATSGELTATTEVTVAPATAAAEGTPTDTVGAI